MSGLASVFPPPPPYYRRYTEEAWAAYQADGAPSTSELAPPPPPTAASPPQQSYRNFGSIWNVAERLPSLEESGIQQLYQPGSEERAATLVPELKRLLYEALLTFVALLRQLSSTPEEFPAKVEHLRALFINMHHLLNTYRPVQSKESLILKMRDQTEAARAAARDMHETNQRIRRQLEALEARLPQAEPNARVALEAGATTDSGPWEGFDLDVDLAEAENEGAIE